jgi:FtsH-binding integral membrane protein
MENNKSPLDDPKNSYFVWWISITILYSALYFSYLDAAHSSSIGGRIAGFLGLFTPVAPLSLITIFIPTFFFAVLVSLGLIGLLIYLDKKNPLKGIPKVIFILVTLLVITFVADFIRGTGYLSWEIFKAGYIPFSG